MVALTPRQQYLNDVARERREVRMPYVGRPMFGCDKCGGIVAAADCPHREKLMDDKSTPRLMVQADAIFFAGVITPVREMRRAGLTDTQIACILCDVRAAAIHEERLRAEMVTKHNPPKFPTWVDMETGVKELTSGPS